jgi:hypothetical protein
MLDQTASLDARTSKGLQSIQRNARTLAQLVDDLKDVSRMISGKMRLDTIPMDLGSVIEAAVEALLPAARVKDIGIHVVGRTRHRGQPVTIRGSADTFVDPTCVHVEPSDAMKPLTSQVGCPHPHHPASIMAKVARDVRPNLGAALASVGTRGDIAQSTS